MILVLRMLSVPFPVFIYRYVTLDDEVHNISMASYLFGQNKLSQISCYDLNSYHVGLQNNDF